MPFFVTGIRTRLVSVWVQMLVEPRARVPSTSRTVSVALEGEAKVARGVDGDRRRIRAEEGPVIVGSARSGRFTERLVSDTAKSIRWVFTRYSVFRGFGGDTGSASWSSTEAATRLLPSRMMSIEALVLSSRAMTALVASRNDIASSSGIVIRSVLYRFVMKVRGVMEVNCRLSVRFGPRRSLS